MHSAVNVHNLRVDRKHRTILSDINFEIESGEIVGLFGPSGAGKTTLIRSLIGLQKIKSGSIHILHHHSGTLRARNLVSYMSQNHGYYTDLTGYENLKYFGRIVNAPAMQSKELLEQLNMADHSDQLLADMSGGQQARISLAIALLGRPEFILLDEPTSGLDPILRIELWRYFRHLASQGATFLVSSHDLTESMHCDRVMLIKNGQILAYERPAYLLESTGSKSMEEVFLKLEGAGA
ncbi:MAG TPA: ABC transporter ATP-binding protein [Candidatus Saccharimonadales bacterium]|nr:ABC transporter ATP-binding protein [Candidatus Saccharimonadales bacterium]